MSTFGISSRKNVLAFALLLLIASVIFTACSSGSASESEQLNDNDDFVLTPEERANLSATAAAFQVQSIAEKEDSGTPIDPPQSLPEFTLTHHTGKAFGSADLTGKNVLVGFAYTHCPDVCPALFGHLINVQRNMEDRIGDDVEMVLISVDPERDTPEWLNQRTEDMNGRWHFLTGSLQELEPVWSDFGVRVEKQGEFVGHTGVTYLVSSEGLMITRYPAYATFEHFIKGIESVTAAG